MIEIESHFKSSPIISNGVINILTELTFILHVFMNIIINSIEIVLIRVFAVNFFMT